MSTNDYYPVFKEIGTEPVMLNAEQLMEKALKGSFNTLQTAILLVKNSLEGFVYLQYGKMPDFFYNNGTTIYKDKPEFLILSFYLQIEEYKTGLLTQIETLLKDRHCELDPGILLFIILENQLVRFPVAIFKSIDLGIFDGYVCNTNTTNQCLKLVQLGERFACEYDFVERINHIYNEKYKSLAEQLKLKLETLDHYRRRFALASNSAVTTEEDLDQLLFQNLVNAKLNGTSEYKLKSFHTNRHTSTDESLTFHQRMRTTTKAFYRAISKNCSEIHTDAAENSISEELTEIFLKASTLYNLPVSSLAETFLVYTQLMLLFSKVTVFRKIKGLSVTEGFPLKSDADEMVLSKTELRNLEKDLDELLIDSRIASFTDFKMKFLLDDELMELHQNHLTQEIKYIDKQISQYIHDIQSVMQMKSQTKKA